MWKKPQKNIYYTVRIIIDMIVIELIPKRITFTGFLCHSEMWVL